MNDQTKRSLFEPCGTCGYISKVEKVKIGLSGRPVTYYCPKCINAGRGVKELVRVVT